MVRDKRLPSVMKHKFSEAPQVSVQRSTFDRSHGYKTTFNAGDLVPVFLDEVLPGDTFKLNHSFFGRVATPITPIMDNLFLDVCYFFVPTRLVWDNWQKFNGEQENPGDSTDFSVPQVLIELADAEVGSLADYFGLPIQNLEEEISVNALPFRCYNLIYNEWFRDQNLIDSLEVPKDDGPDGYDNFELRKRGKRHDYFTSCLPWPQKGDAVDLPLATQAPVILDPASEDVNRVLYRHSDDYSRPFDTGNKQMYGYSNTGEIWTSPSTGNNYYNIDPNGTLIADLSQAGASTINDLREAFQIQRLLEKDARGGTRYTEIIRSHFGVVSPDARLQRPEYLGGSHDHVSISPIPQTSETTDDSPQGNLAAYGTFSSMGRAFTHSFTEHGYVIGIANVRADLTYQQGVERLWNRETRFDFYWPALSHLGEQEVLRKEIYATGAEEDDNLVFGYQERYAEYRYKPSRITGQFRSGVTDSIDIWHLSQSFDDAPELNESFIQEDVPMSRIKAVEDYPDLILDSYFNLKCTRPMPVYSIPGYIDHF